MRDLQPQSKPFEYRLPNDLLWMVTMSTYVGRQVAGGCCVLWALFQENPYNRVEDNDQKIIAWGVLTGAMIGSIYSIATRLRYLIRNRSAYVLVDEQATNLGLEYKRNILTVNATKFYFTGLRVFLASQAAAVVGALVLTNIGDKFKNMGISLEFSGLEYGEQLGALFGAIIGFLLFPVFLCRTEQVSKIKAMKWYNESRHNVAFYARLFFGLWTGYVMVYGLTMPIQQEGHIFNQNLALSTITCGLAALLSPHFFWLLRYVLQFFRFHQAQDDLNDNAQFKAPRWFGSSRHDLPWYINLFAGTVTAAAVGLANAVYHKHKANHADSAYPPIHVNTSFMYIINALALATPLMSEKIEALLGRYGPQYFTVEELNKPTPPKLSDMAWPMRAAFGALAGKMLGDALFYATYDGYSASLPELSLLVIWGMICFSLLTPSLTSLVDRFSWIPKCFKSTDDSELESSWPWYANCFFGLCLGALVVPSARNVCASLHWCGEYTGSIIHQHTIVIGPFIPWWPRILWC